jgi:hypothetical protein
LTGGPRATLGNGDEDAASLAPSFGALGNGAKTSAHYEGLHDDDDAAKGREKASRRLARRQARSAVTDGDGDGDAQNAASGSLHPRGPSVKGDLPAAAKALAELRAGGAFGSSVSGPSGTLGGGGDDVALAVADPNDLEAILNLHHGAEELTEQARVAAEKAAREASRRAKTARRESKAERKHGKPKSKSSPSRRDELRADGKAGRSGSRWESSIPLAANSSGGPRATLGGDDDDDDDGDGDDGHESLAGSDRRQSRESLPQPPGMAPPASLPPGAPGMAAGLRGRGGPTGVLGSEAGDDDDGPLPTRRESKKDHKKKSKKASSGRESGRGSREVSALLAGMVAEEPEEDGEAALEAMFRNSRASRGPKASI